MVTAWKVAKSHVQHEMVPFLRSHHIHTCTCVPCQEHTSWMLVQESDQQSWCRPWTLTRWPKPCLRLWTRSVASQIYVLQYSGVCCSAKNNNNKTSICISQARPYLEGLESGLETLLAITIYHALVCMFKRSWWLMRTHCVQWNSL